MSFVERIKLTDGTEVASVNTSNQLEVAVGQWGGTAVVNGGTAGTIAVGGIQAHDAPLSGNNPILVGGVGSSVTPTAVTNGDLSRFWLTTTGALNIADAGGSITVDGTVAVTQSGTWDINSITTANLAADDVHDLSAGTTLVMVGGFASSTVPTAVTNGDAARIWLTTTGAINIADAGSSITVDGTVTAVGDVSHDVVDSGNPQKIGAKAIAHSSNPAAVAAADRTDLYANRHGILWTIGGHPNLQSAEYITTAAQTGDNVLPLVSTGTKYVITGVTVAASAANTVNVSVRLGFGTSAVPTQGASAADAVTKVILSHPGIAPGSGISKGHAGGIVGIGGDAEELYIACSVPTGGSLVVQVDYYTIES